MFVAIDVETANATSASICQIGLVVMDEGKEIHSECYYLNPNEYFSSFNIGIHGIDEETVRGSQTFPEQYQHLANILATNHTVAHSPFDRGAIRRACEKYELPNLPCHWLDSVRVARRAWPDLNSYGLFVLASAFGIQFEHHNALEDARTCAMIMQRAIDETGISISDWYARVELPISGVKRTRKQNHSDLRRKAAGDGPLYGETIVITGKIEMGKQSAADLVARMGADFDSSVTKRTTVLVVGDRDAHFGSTKSMKHQKAEAMILSGHQIRIITESDFLALCEWGGK